MTATSSRSRASRISSHACRPRIDPAQQARPHLVRMTPDIVYDQLIGWAARASSSSRGRQPRRRLAVSLRDAVEHGWLRRSSSRSTRTRAWRGRIRSRRVEPAVRRAARLSRRRPTGTNPRRADHLPVHRRAAARCRRFARRRHRPRAAGRPARATCSSGESSACKRRWCSSTRSIVTVEEIVDELAYVRVRSYCRAG